jgi:hypothetical protein
VENTGRDPSGQPSPGRAGSGGGHA